MRKNIPPLYNLFGAVLGLEGTQVILQIWKKPNTIGMSKVLDTGNPALYWATIV